MSIIFPAMNITIKDWNPNEDYLMYILMSPYYYVKKESLYNEFYKNNKFIDSEGKIYKILDRKLPTSIWRKIFGFLPNVYKVELIFLDTGETLTIEDIREFLLKQINKLEKEDYIIEWIKQIKKSKTIKGILSGED